MQGGWRGLTSVFGVLPAHFWLNFVARPPGPQELVETDSKAELKPAVCFPHVPDAETLTTDAGRSLAKEPELCAMEQPVVLHWLAQPVAVQAAEGIEKYVSSVKDEDMGSTVAQPMKSAIELGEPETMFAVVKMYTQNEVYRGANQLLRQFDWSSMAAEEREHPLWEFIVLLQVCLMTRERVTGPIDLWRGIKEPADKLVPEYREKVGSVVVWPPFTSTSRERAVAEGFAGSSGVVFKIHVSKEALAIPALGAVDVQEMSAYSEEREILLATSIPLRVKKVEEGEPRSVVHLEVDTGELRRLQQCLEEVWLKWGTGAVAGGAPRGSEPARSREERRPREVPLDTEFEPENAL
jgi:hypothetical protein